MLTAWRPITQLARVLLVHETAVRAALCVCGRACFSKLKDYRKCPNYWNNACVSRWH
ncbi:unnamed protein product [Mycetohabitans rhizoxinica HKI 454]|uniref:Transposase n=1 Tax=Mycetohabitans rhizoxinica (strain DSM 19002 / CIP 109453 / HKI 454) TaxID=882378 RepID=E5AQ87_MYCRK|nr:unnamed protein product [Mycetohabitans rhizoxinica HKI 454]